MHPSGSEGVRSHTSWRVQGSLSAGKGASQVRWRSPASRGGSREPGGAGRGPARHRGKSPPSERKGTHSSSGSGEASRRSLRGERDCGAGAAGAAHTHPRRAGSGARGRRGLAAGCAET